VEAALDQSIAAAQSVGQVNLAKWTRAGYAWLAAGYLDRAALALHEAGSEEAEIWARAPQTRGRFNSNKGEALRCLYWYPDT